MRISRSKLLLLVGMSLFGLWASGMVLIVYYLLKETLPFCPTTQGPGIVFDCAAVLSSSYGQIFGIPLELIAVFYFIVNLVLVYMIAFGRNRLFGAALNVLFVWRFIGILIVPYLIFAEVFLIHAICLYCTVMHVAIIADFAIISYLLFFREKGFFEEVSSSEIAGTETGDLSASARGNDTFGISASARSNPTWISTSLPSLRIATQT